MKQDDHSRLSSLLRRIEKAADPNRPPRTMPPHGKTFLAGYNDAVAAGDPSWFAVTQGLGQAATIFILDLVEAMQAAADGVISAEDARFLARTLERNWQEETATVHATLLGEVAAIHARQQRSH